MTETPFHRILDLDFTNDPYEIAKFIKSFICHGNNQAKLKTIYTETNGFDINPDRWFFDLFGIEYYGGHDDYDWLSDIYTSSDPPGKTLKGMEELQKTYAPKAFRNENFEDARDFCSLLVVLRFQTLIHRSAMLLENLKIPILATSHDYDFIYEYKR